MPAVSSWDDRLGREHNYSRHSNRKTKTGLLFFWSFFLNEQKSTKRTHLRQQVYFWHAIGHCRKYNLFACFYTFWSIAFLNLPTCSILLTACWSIYFSLQMLFIYHVCNHTISSVWKSRIPKILMDSGKTDGVTEYYVEENTACPMVKWKSSQSSRTL